jgi:IPT/TIG domain
MKLSFVALLLGAAGLAIAQSASPLITGVDPPTGKRGDVITAAGQNLQKENVAKVYLTDGESDKNDIQVEITSQTATEIKFRIPAKTMLGRMALMILTTTKPPQLIEQPVKLTVDQGEGAAAATAAKAPGAGGQ